MNDSVRLDVASGIATITLDRPEVRNAIDKLTADALATAVDEIDRRADVRVAVITGAGSVFCAGMDLKAFSATGERPVHPVRGAFGFVAKPPAKPVIAAIEGNALGGGLEIALACDLIVATRSAKFGLPEVRRGLVAAAGGVVRLPRRIPRGVAMELILTGETISADRGLELGLVNCVAEDGHALEAAQELANLIAANAPLAVLAAKRIVNESSDWAIGELFELQAPYTDEVRCSNDAAEGARAFVEKRQPQWTGS